MRLRHASRVFENLAQADRAALSTLAADDILASRVFQSREPS
jgi:hypothetical protein